LTKEGTEESVDPCALEPWVKGPTYNPLSQPNTLNDLILDSIDEALSDLLGIKGRDLIYDHIARHHSFGREDIPLHLEEFHTLLENTFSTGSRTISRTIIRRLYDKLDWKFVVVPGYEFNDYLKAVRARIGLELFGRARINLQESLGKKDSTT